MFAYVGSRTTRERNARGDGISVFHFDPASGALDLVQVVGDLLNPSFLTINRAGDVLYTVHGDYHEVSAFRVDRPTGCLTWLNTQDCQGKNPVHLALDPSGQHMVVSNHITGTLAVLPVAEDGALRPVSQLVTLEGKPGPHRTEQPFAKPHFNPFSPCGRWVLVPDKGLDKVFVFGFENGRLVPAAQPHLDLREGAGPRHLAFHPTQPWVYVVNELDNTVTSCHFDAQTGALQAFQIVPTLADSFTGNSRSAEIEVHPEGHTLYASNRGEDSIAVFGIDPNKGRLCPRQTMPSGGKTPRFFTTEKNGRRLFVLNEESDEIVRHSLASDGLIDAANCRRWNVGSPVCMVFSGR